MHYFVKNVLKWFLDWMHSVVIVVVFGCRVLFRFFIWHFYGLLIRFNCILNGQFSVSHDISFRMDDDVKPLMWHENWIIKSIHIRRLIDFIFNKKKSYHKWFLSTFWENILIYIFFVRLQLRFVFNFIINQSNWMPKELINIKGLECSLFLFNS